MYSTQHFGPKIGSWGFSGFENTGFKILESGAPNFSMALCYENPSVYERGWPSYFIIVRRGKNVDVRGVKICAFESWR